MLIEGAALKGSVGWFDGALDGVLVSEGEDEGNLTGEMLGGEGGAATNGVSVGDSGTDVLGGLVVGESVGPMEGEGSVIGETVGVGGGAAIDGVLVGDAGTDVLGGLVLGGIVGLFVVGKLVGLLVGDPGGEGGWVGAKVIDMI